MRLLFIFALILNYANASLLDISSFEADFTQTITDEKNKVLKYKGHILASKPDNASWNYVSPIEKQVFISKYEATIVEPEIEQVIIRRISSEFDFFHLVQTAKEISKDNYVTVYNNTKYSIKTNNGLVESIYFLDQFENKVKIVFSAQRQNHKIDKDRFIPKYPIDFDIIRD
ncbi:LolA-like outer membrane lipoprotein chaperone [Sulfurimonas sp.]|uniref:LolA-like outer membrane lipoprotein chaperone n=1 Tax=Sulfurimonas sp. TaxID=2022749 RepID=UPI0035665023